MGQGRALLAQGRVDEGIARLDEAMVAVTADELTPPSPASIYCGLIAGCHGVYDLRRAQEWTAALSSWCAGQPDLVVYTGECLVHRAEVMQHHGAWRDALEEAEQAREALRGAARRKPASRRRPLSRGELHRLRGESHEAEEAYREAARSVGSRSPAWRCCGSRRARRDAAVAAIRRAVDGDAPIRCTRQAAPRVRRDHARGRRGRGRPRRGRDELAAIARAAAERRACCGRAAHARGAVLLADGDARAALTELREACTALAGARRAVRGRARPRVLVGPRLPGARRRGQRGAGARRGTAASSSSSAPRRISPRAEALVDARPLQTAGGLTRAGAGGVRLVATGKTNRAIADELVISEKTVARHVSNVFTKLRVSSRSAPTAYAYEHDLV